MQENIITDIKIPFWRLVVIFVKWAIALIPAAIILTVIWAMSFGAIMGLVGGIGQFSRRF